MATTSAGSIEVELTGDSSELSDALDQATQSVNQTNASLRTLAKISAAAFAAIGTGVGLAFNELEKIRQAEGQLESAVMGAGAAFDINIDTLKKYAGELSRTTKFSKAQITSGMAMLESFGLTEKQLLALTPKVTQLATFMGNDLNQVANAMGKSFFTGAGALSEQNLALTDLQKASFGALDMGGKVAMLMEIIENNVRGANESMTQTAGVAFTKMTHATGGLLAEFAKLIEAPVIQFFTEGLTPAIHFVTDAFAGLSGPIKSAIVIISVAATAITGLTIAVVAFSTAAAVPAIAAFGAAIALVGPIIAVIVAKIAALVAIGLALKVAYEKNLFSIRNFVDSVAYGFKETGEAIKDAFDWFISEGVAKISSGIKDVRDWIDSVAQAISDWLMIDAPDWIIGKFGELSDFVSELTSNIAAWFSTLFDDIVSATARGVDLVVSYFDWIIEPINSIIADLADIWGQFVDYLASNETVQSIVAVFSENFEKIKTKIIEVFDAVVDAWETAKTKLSEGVTSVVDGVKSIFGEVEEQAKSAVGAVVDVGKAAGKTVVGVATEVAKETKTLVKEVGKEIGSLTGKLEFGEKKKKLPPKPPKPSAEPTLVALGGEAGSGGKAADAWEMTWEEQENQAGGVLNSFNESLEETQKNIEEGKKKIATQTSLIVGAAENFGATVVGSLGAGGEVIKAGMEGFATGGPIGALIGIIMTILMKLENVQKAFDLANEGFGKLLDAINPLLDVLVDINETINGFLEPIFVILEEVFTVLGNIIQKAMEPLNKLMAGLGGIIKGLLPVIMSLIEAFTPLIDAVLNLLSAIDFINPLLIPLAEVIGIFARVIADIVHAFRGAINTITKIVNDVVRFFGGKVSVPPPPPAIGTAATEEVASTYSEADLESIRKQEAAKTANLLAQQEITNQTAMAQLEKKLKDQMRAASSPSAILMKKQKEAAESVDTLSESSNKTADSVDKMAESAEEATSSLSNVPTGVKLAQQRFAATAGEMGSFGRGIAPGGINGIGSEITTNNYSIVVDSIETQDPVDLVAQLQREAQRQALISTGSSIIREPIPGT